MSAGAPIPLQTSGNHPTSRGVDNGANDTRFAFLGGDTPDRRAIVAVEWAATALGPVEGWSSTLRTAAAFCLAADHPCALYWGKGFTMLHNLAFVEALDGRGSALGKPAAEVWGDWWPMLDQQIGAVLATGVGRTLIDQHFPLVDDGGVARDEYWTCAYTPFRDEHGHPVGVRAGLRQTTPEVLRRQTDALLIALDEQLLQAASVDAMMAMALRLIGEHLQAKRTGYAEVDEEAATLLIRRTWAGAEMPDIAGHYPLGTFGRMSDGLRAGQAAVIEDNRTDPRTNDAATIAIYDRIRLRSGIVAPVLERGCYVGGIFVQDDVPRRWTEQQAVLVQAAAQRLWQALARLRNETALRESEQRYRLIFEQADDIVFTADLEQRVTDCNAAGAASLGYQREAIMGRSIADFVSPADFAQTTAMLQSKLADGGNTRHEVTVIGRDGRAMRWENNSTLIVDRDGRPVGLLSISRDVTERRAFDDRQKLLIHELNHRVKNTLSLVQGIAHQSFRAGVDSAVAQADFLARIGTLAAAHDLLTREQWEGVTLAELIRAATAPHRGDRVDAHGAAVTLTPRAAVAIAMALHELGTNAVKYGALSVPDGHVEIAWTLDDARLRIDWRERDGPPVAVPQRRGFGVKMIERALASDLGGSVTMDFANTGVTCAIDAPRKGNLA